LLLISDNLPDLLEVLDGLKFKPIISMRRREGWIFGVFFALGFGGANRPSAQEQHLRVVMVGEGRFRLHVLAQLFDEVRLKNLLYVQRHSNQ
jgi:hypothetical protein